MAAPSSHDARRQAGTAVAARRGELAEQLVAREIERHPQLAQRHGAAARAKSLQDAGDHLAHLAEALAHDRPALFVDYVAWARIVLVQRGIAAADLAFHLACMAEVLRARLPAGLGAAAAAVVDAAVAALPGMPDELPSFLHDAAPLSPLAHQYCSSLLRADRQAAGRLVLDSVACGTGLREVYLHVFEPSQHEVGRLWQMNRVTVAQEHYCTAATQLVMSQLYPQLFDGERRGRRLVAACVASDLHEIGARMVADFFEMEGWDTFYTGAGTPQDAVLAALVAQRADLLAVSATIASHVHEVARLVDAVRAHPQLGAVRILVGGHAFNRLPGLWREVGADGRGANAQKALEAAGQWFGA
jgi:methanogenic corrinoid protein MtbC1